MSRYTTGNGETLMTSKKALAALILISFGSVAALPAAADPGLPSYAAPAPQGAQGESIHGTIAAVIDKYHLTLNDDRGFVDHVTLRASTTINPPGLTLQNGEPVMINGHADGHEFVAEEIDAPNPDAPGDNGDAGAYNVAPDDDAYAYGPPAYDPYYYGYPYGGIGIGIGFYGGGYYGGYYGGRGHGYGHGYGHGGYGYGHGGGYGGHGYGGGYGGRSSGGGYGARASAGGARSFGGGGARGGGGGTHGGGGGRH
jgi:hypothetical protein